MGRGIPARAVGLLCDPAMALGAQAVPPCWATEPWAVSAAAGARRRAQCPEEGVCWLGNLGCRTFFFKKMIYLSLAVPGFRCCKGFL